MFELGPAFPTVSTARWREAVESGCRECKARSNAGLMRIAKNPALHVASIVVHSPGFPVKVGGVDELHAAFRKESRTRGCWRGARYRKSGSGQCPHSELVSFRIAFGCFHPDFLMAVVGESELGDAAVRTLLKCDARTAPTGINKPVGKLRE